MPKKSKSVIETEGSSGVDNNLVVRCDETILELPEKKKKKKPKKVAEEFVEVDVKIEKNIDEYKEKNAKTPPMTINGHQNLLCDILENIEDTEKHKKKDKKSKEIVENVEDTKKHKKKDKKSKEIDDNEILETSKDQEINSEITEKREKKKKRKHQELKIETSNVEDVSNKKQKMDKEVVENANTQENSEKFNNREPKIIKKKNRIRESKINKNNNGPNEKTKEKLSKKKNALNALICKTPGKPEDIKKKENNALNIGNIVGKLGKGLLEIEGFDIKKRASNRTNEKAYVIIETEITTKNINKNGLPDIKKPEVEAENVKEVMEIQEVEKRIEQVENLEQLEKVVEQEINAEIPEKRKKKKKRSTHEELENETSIVEDSPPKKRKKKEITNDSETMETNSGLENLDTDIKEKHNEEMQHAVETSLVEEEVVIEKRKKTKGKKKQKPILNIESIEPQLSVENTYGDELSFSKEPEIEAENINNLMETDEVQAETSVENIKALPERKDSDEVEKLEEQTGDLNQLEKGEETNIQIPEKRKKKKKRKHQELEIETFNVEEDPKKEEVAENLSIQETTEESNETIKKVGIQETKMQANETPTDEEKKIKKSKSKKKKKSSLDIEQINDLPDTQVANLTNEESANEINESQISSNEVAPDSKEKGETSPGSTKEVVENQQGEANKPVANKAFAPKFGIQRRWGGKPPQSQRKKLLEMLGPYKSNLSETFIQQAFNGANLINLTGYEN